MLNVTLIAVGKLKERYLTDACAEYEKRLGAYCRLRVVELDEYRLPQKPTEEQDRKSTRLNSSHSRASRMPSSA